MAPLRTKKGTHLTKKVIEELADEAERGYDLSKARRQIVRAGRPSLDKGESPRISYRLTGNLYKRAKARAKSEGRTISEIARDALERYVERRKDAGRHPFFLAEEAEQQVLGADVVVLERAGFLLRENDNLACALGETLEHVAGTLRPRRARRQGICRRAGALSSRLRRTRVTRSRVAFE